VKAIGWNCCKPKFRVSQLEPIAKAAHMGEREERERGKRERERERERKCHFSHC
jgi:hypothetical protein